MRYIQYTTGRVVRCWGSNYLHCCPLTVVSNAACQPAVPSVETRWSSIFCGISCQLIPWHCVGEGVGGGHLSGGITGSGAWYVADSVYQSNYHVGLPE